MAKKTKREKILAELHREKQKLAVQVSSSAGVPKYQLSLSESKKINPSSQNPILLPELRSTRTDYSYVLHDLSHTLILTALAICAQLSIYYVLSTRHLL